MDGRTDRRASRQADREANDSDTDTLTFGNRQILVAVVSVVAAV